jgi:hypothetical protein
MINKSIRFFATEVTEDAEESGTTFYYGLSL